MASVVADVTLYDKNKKKTIDRKRRTIMRVPEYTKKGSFVVEGNSYTVPYQQRLRPGVYTLKKRNGEINTMFNLGKGRNFNMKIDKGGNLKIKVGSLHVSLYSILRDLGVSDQEMQSVWGKELLEINKKSYSPADAQKFMKAFKYSSDSINEHNAKDELRKAIHESTVSPEAVKETLGIKEDKLNPKMILAASKKLLGVYNGTVKQDDRENMIFKQIMAPEDMLGEAFSKNIKEEINKIKFKLGNPSTAKIDDVLGTGTAALTRPIKNFIVSSKASRLSEEYNPLMMHTTTHFITPMGEGGVGDTRALNLDTKAVHQSHLGFIDPIVSPEGAAVGITLAVTDNAYIDDTGAPAISVVNAKTGKKEVKRIADLWDKNLAYPISKERIKTDGIMVRRGNQDFKAKSKKDVDYILESSLDMHAPSSNVIPLINSSDANRTNMAQKHAQQALSLKSREVPHVAVGKDGEDFNRTMLKDSGHIPFSPVSGKVTKIDKDFIHIKDSSGNVVAMGEIYTYAIQSSHLAALARANNIPVIIDHGAPTAPGSFGGINLFLILAVAGLSIVTFLLVLRKPRAVIVNSVSRLVGTKASRRPSRPAPSRSSGQSAVSPAALVPGPAPAGSPRIRLRGRAPGGQSFDFGFDAEQMKASGGRLIVGRNPDLCQLHLPHDSVSRQHATLILNDGKLYLEDRSSGNGTFVNGNEIPVGGAPAPLHPNDRLTLGEVDLMVDVRN
jgi:DNA-directed RNA polymerase beta subunit